MSSFAQQLRSKLFGNVLGGSSKASAASGVDLSRKTRRNSSTAHLDIEKNPYSFGTVQYPDDLGTAEFGHYIMFYIYEVAKSKYAGPQTETSEILVERPPQMGGDFKKTIEKKHKKQEGITSSARTTQPLKGADLAEREKNLSMSGALKRSGRLKRTSDVIALYMPPNFKSTYRANYKASETGLAGVLGQQLAEATSVDSMLKQLGDTGTFNTIMSALTDTLTMKLAAGAADLVTGGDLEGVLRKGQQKALNPAVEAIFQSVDLRTFNYNFRFTPRSEAEVRTVDNIIKLFKFHMLPERVQNEAIGRHLIFPSEFEIYYMFQGVENQWYPFTGQCVLENMDVSYGPGGESQHFRPVDGSPPPTEINMSLTFKETEIMTKEKIVEGY
tara:strand:+ start:354 stop:1511 length:1158 start_codon:yes stop_codon:yes gene_type:complete